MSDTLIDKLLLPGFSRKERPETMKLPDGRTVRFLVIGRKEMYQLFADKREPRS